MPTTIDLMRHGEPVGGRKYRGQIDDELSAKGWAEMWRTVGDCRDWDVIVSSPLARCRAFAEALADKLALPLSLDARCMEIAFGAWEGRTAAEIEQETPGVVAAYKADPLAHRPQGAESVTDFHARVGDAWRELLAAHAGRRVLLVCHAGVIRMTLAHVLGMPPVNAYRIQIAGASVTRIVVDATGHPTLLFMDGSLASVRNVPA
jgi:alpha-ribazole phosphatase/probable phosphoglycerate mutase